MSAECSTCGRDLVYGEKWPEMFCEACDLRARNAALLAALEWIVKRAGTSFGGPIVPGDIERVARAAIEAAKEE